MSTVAVGVYTVNAGKTMTVLAEAPVNIYTGQRSIELPAGSKVEVVSSDDRGTRGYIMHNNKLTAVKVFPFLLTKFATRTGNLTKNNLTNKKKSQKNKKKSRKNSRRQTNKRTRKNRKN